MVRRCTSLTGSSSWWSTRPPQSRPLHSQVMNWTDGGTSGNTHEPPTTIRLDVKQERLAVASIARDDPSTLPGDDPFLRARMHCDCNAR